MVDRIRFFFDPAREPLRRNLYTALAGIIGMAVTAGLLTSEAAVTVTGVLSAVLVGAVGEYIRTLVTPYVPENDEPGAHAADRADGV